jgi:tetratricopeptide (TPR) repeat protein
LGEEHPDVAGSLNNLAALLEAQGKYDEAEPLYRQSLAIDRKVSVLMYVCLFHRTSSQVYGDEHPEVATDLNNLAVLLEAQGKYNEAEPVYRQSLVIMRMVLGEEHPDVTTSLNNLAALLNAQGKYDESIPLLRQSLGIMRKVLGEEHPAVATALNNLAELLRAQGKDDEAEPLYRQSLEILRKILGEEHPNVARSLNNLAGLLKTQGKYDKAEHLYRQSLANRRKVCAIHLAASSRDHSCKVLGEEHPAVATALNNLAVLLKAQGKYDEAEPLYQQSLAISRKVCAIHLSASSRDHSCKALGEQHPDVADSLNNLAVAVDHRTQRRGLCIWQAGIGYCDSSVRAQSSDNTAIPQGLGVSHSEEEKVHAEHEGCCCRPCVWMPPILTQKTWFCVTVCGIW